MTDKDIEICLKDLEDSEFGMTGFKKKPNVFGHELTVYAQEYRNLKYLQNDLKLIHILEEKDEGSILFLSSKGKEVLEKGNWVKYKNDLKIKDRNNRNMKVISFWFNIIIPVFSIYIAYLALKLNNESMKKELLIELRNINQTTIKEEVKSYMEKLSSKKKDNLILNEKKNE